MHKKAPGFTYIASRAAWILVAIVSSTAAARSAEIRFADATLSVAESTSTLTVGLELTAPECAGEVRLPESIVRLLTAAGGPNPAAERADFAVVAEAVPLGVTGRPPIRFGRQLSGVVVDDQAFDGFEPETFQVMLELPAAVAVECLGDDVAAPLTTGPPLTVEIVDDDPPPVVAFSQARDTVSEAQGSKTYSLVKTGASGRVAATLDSESRRLTIEPSLLTWADGETGAREFTVFFEDDDVVRGDTRAVLTLALEGAVAGDPEELVITIREDDQPPEPAVIAFNRGAATIREARQEATFALRRTGGLEGAVGAALSLDTSGVTLDPAAVSWGDGESGVRPFTVRFDDDTRREDDQRIVVTFRITAGNAEAGSPARLVITIGDDDQAAAVAVAGGDNQTGSAGTTLAQRLQVLVTNRAGQGVEGETVSWTVVAGDATLTDGAATETGAGGQTSNGVRLGAAAGTVRVRAEAASSGVAVEFRAEVLSGDPVGDALLRACAGNDENLAGVCGYFFGLGAAEQQAVIEEIRPEEVASQVNVTQDAPRVQLGNVGARLAALRRGGTSSGVQQLAMSLRGLPLSPQALATALTRRPASGLDPAAAVERALAAAAASGVELQDDEPPSPPAGAAAEPDVPGRLGFFVNGSLSFGDRAGTLLETGFDFDTLGLTAGLDYRLRPGLFLGGALGYLNTETDLAGDGGTLDTDGLSFTVYLMRYWEGGLYIQGVAGYGDNDYDQVRNIDLATPFLGQRRYAARGQTGGTQTSLALELGYDASRGALTVGGFGRLSSVTTDVDGFRETGDANGRGFYLEVFDQSTDSLLGEAGIQLSYAASYSWGVLSPQGRLSFLHEFADSSRDIRARFIEDSDPTNVFAIPTEEPDRDYFNVGVGFGAQFKRGVSAFLFYDTDLDRADLDVSTFTAGVRFEF